MLAQIDDVVTELKEHERSSEPLSVEQQAAIAAPDAPSFGPADAKVTVVEFSDFECPYCARAAEVTSRLRERYADRVRLVFRQFPLSFHDNDRGAAEASLAAHAQGKFWEYHDRLFAHQDQLGRSALGEHARAVGLDVAALERALEDGLHAARVTGDVALGNEVAVQGTPTLFVNGQRVENPLDFDAVARQIDAALSQ
jgi:protein-disulfide isomerase